MKPTDLMINMFLGIIVTLPIAIADDVSTFEFITLVMLVMIVLNQKTMSENE